MNNKVLVALSGGVDSTAASCLLLEQGVSCAGAMMKLGPDNADEDARTVAAALGMPYHWFDFFEDFQREVIGRFVEAYQNGLTPNPCVECNRQFKFGRFLQRALEMGFDAVATGHYVRVEHGQDGARHLLKKGMDASKDQSYALYRLTQEQLAHAVFPLGGLSKVQARALLTERGLSNASKKESQDICFVPDGDYAAFIRRHTGCDCPPGRFVGTDGQDLGEHRGLIHYTVGQRRGLGLPAESRLYALELRPEDNTVVVGREKELYKTEVMARNINLISVARLDEPMRVRAKLRYRHPEQPATVWQLDEDLLRVVFDEPQRAPAPGQAVVLYDGDVVVGGGTIDRWSRPS